MQKKWFVEEFDDLEDVAEFANRHNLSPSEMVVVAEPTTVFGFTLDVEYNVMYYAYEKLSN